MDFNGTAKVQAKGGVVFRGAYAGEETNPGWQLNEGVKAASPAVPSPAATLVWIDPANGEGGKSTLVTLTGTNFTEGSVVAFSGADIKAGSITVAGATRITATVAIGADTAAGARQVTVNTPSGSSNTLTFRVTSRGGN